MKSIKGETVVGVAHCLKLEHHTKSPLEYTTRILPEPPLSTKVKKTTTTKTRVQDYRKPLRSHPCNAVWKQRSHEK